MSAPATQYIIRCHVCRVELKCDPLQPAGQAQDDPALKALIQKLYRHLEKAHTAEFQTVMAFAILTNFEVEDPVLKATKEGLKGIVRPLVMA